MKGNGRTTPQEKLKSLFKSWLQEHPEDKQHKILDGAINRLASGLSSPGKSASQPRTQAKRAASRTR